MLVHLTRNDLRAGDVIAPGNWGASSDLRDHRIHCGSARRFWKRFDPRSSLASHRDMMLRLRLLN